MPEHVPAGYDPAGKTVAWSSFHDEARDRLRSAGFTTADIDARRLVEEASGYEGTEFHFGLKEPATKRGVSRFDAMIERRLNGEPLQYVVGRWGFRTLDLMVDQRVLIPRPETEVVTGVALDELDRLAARGRQLTAVDMGTGSGAIGLSLAAERSNTDVVLTDASTEALQVARANLAGIGRAGTRVTILEGSWFEALAEQLRGQVDLIVSNPPYVATREDLSAEVRDWEPTAALMAGDAGRSNLEVLLAGANAWLRPGGAVVLEMSPEQTDWGVQRAADAGFVEVEVMADMAGRKRALRARWPA